MKKNHALIQRRRRSSWSRTRGLREEGGGGRENFEKKWTPEEKEGFIRTEGISDPLPQL